MATTMYPRPLLLSLTAVILAATGFAQNPPPTPSVSNKAHRATLNWAPSPDAKKAGVNLKYRMYKSDGTRKPGGATECAGTFHPVATVNSSEKSFTDTGVQADHIYCYKVQ